jgi:hypothetical protein
VHVSLLELYTPTLPGHGCRHVKNLLKFSCCNKYWTLGIAVTSIIYSSVASSKAFENVLVYSHGGVSENWSAKTLELTTSWCSILRTVQMNALVDQGGFPFRLWMNCLHSSEWIAANYILLVDCRSQILCNVHPIAWFSQFSLAPVLCTIFNFSSSCIFLVAISAAVQWGFWAWRWSKVLWIVVIGVEAGVSKNSSMNLLLDAVACGWAIAWKNGK